MHLCQLYEIQRDSPVLYHLRKTHPVSVQVLFLEKSLGNKGFLSDNSDKLTDGYLTYADNGDMIIQYTDCEIFLNIFLLRNQDQMT